MNRLALAIIAGAILAVSDYILIATSFLYNPEPAEWMIVGGLVVFGTAVALKQKWLVFAVQNMVSTLLIIRIAQGREGFGVYEAVFLLIVIAGGNGLAWLITRAIPNRPARAV